MTEIIGQIAAALTTVSFLPQAIKTIRTKNTGGISLTMYIILCAGMLLWLVYGIRIQNKPIIYANSVTSVFALIVLIYKVKNLLKNR